MIQISGSMNLFANSNALIMTSFWISSFLHIVSGDKPRCIGQALDQENFSKPGDVGFVRDLCVDVVARNINNELGLKASSVCEELANMRTSTCVAKNICLKWKRLYCWNAMATQRVTIRAEELTEQLIGIFTKDMLLEDYDHEKFIFEHIDKAEGQLIDSQAATKESKIIENLESLKKYCCTRFHFGQYQAEYLKSRGKYDNFKIECVEKLVNNDDLGPCIKIFIRKFEAENGVKITKYFTPNRLFWSSNDIISDIPKINFQFTNGAETQEISVFMKISSLYRIGIVDEELTRGMFAREVHFYVTLLPQLYKLGNCEPFSARLLAAKDTKAFILEDLTLQGYQEGDAEEQLELDQIRVSLDVLAQYHALSSKYLQTLSQDDPRMLFIKSHPPLFIEMQKQLAFSKHFGLLKRRISGDLYQKIQKMESEILAAPRITKYPDENSLKVMMHGDYRTNNILFRKDSAGKVIQAKIIDWQLCGEASPVIDLIYFFVTSVSIYTFRDHDDELQNFYINKLKQRLSSVYSIHSYDRSKLDIDILYYKHYLLRVILIDWPRMMLAKSNPNDDIKYEIRGSLWLNYLEKKGII